MSIIIGGIDLFDAVINLEYQLRRTQRTVEWLIKNNQNLNKPNDEVMKKIDEESVKFIKEKFPDAGIHLRNDS